MAEVSEEISQTLDADKPLEAVDPQNQDNGAEETMDASIPASKRPREGAEEKDDEEDDNDVPKKPKTENSVHDMQLDGHEENEEIDGEAHEGEGEDEYEEGEGEDEDDEDEGEGEGEESEEANEGAGEEKESVSVNLGPKVFNSSAKMYDYFNKLLHYWPTNVNVNKYEYTVLLDLLRKGNAEHDKIAEGVCAFQVRIHPTWKSRCFFFIKEDASMYDFSFRKCIEKILPLPDYMKAYASNATNTGYQRGGRGRGRSFGGRGGRSFGGRGGGGGGGGGGGRRGGRGFGGRGGRGGGRRGRGRRGRGQY